MEYTLLQLTWLFFIYSFLGWIGEVCLAAIRKKTFVNRGFINGPLCPIYGFASLLFAIFLPDLVSRPGFLFLAGLVIATVLEYMTGTLMEKIFHKKLWDYSSIRWNLDGYICFRYSLLWGAFSVLAMKFLNPLLCRVTGLVPHFIAVIILWTLAGFLFLDFTGTSLAVLGMHKHADHFTHFTRKMQKTSYLLENKLTEKIQKRMMRSFPSITLDEMTRQKKEKKASAVFAEGCCFYKLVSLFFIGAFLGDITETIFCLITSGKLMSRSSVVYGPFSIVWGLACALLTALLYRYRNKSDRYIFIAGTILGGVYEYICSVFTEIVFGTVFWDYSGFAFNLGGRINLLYCFFWGIAAVVWLKFLYPKLSGLIEKLPKKGGKILCNVMIVFMIFNIIISGMALSRYTARNTEPAAPVEESPAVQTINDFLDSHFPDQRMERIYPNAKIVD